MYKPRLKEVYSKEIVPKMMEKFGLNNPMEVPAIKHVVLNMGVSAAKDDIKVLDEAREELAVISGQAPVTTRARKSVSNFKLRQHMPIGCKVTLRGAKMYEFLDRLINCTLPRVRDFRGISELGFDKQGNYTLGMKNELIFPEINVDKITKAKGLSITIVTSSSNADYSFELLKLFGMPFRKKK